MTLSIDSAVGFLSYSHLDDEADEGRIRRLAQKIQAEYRVLTGQELHIFVDRTDIAWGENWRERISGALQSTTFFIPVISPSFFASDECRNEFFEFYTVSRSLGVPSYLLAIRYAETEGLHESSADEAKAIAAQTQYKDWKELRLVDENAAIYRQAINDLARELQGLMRLVESQPAQDAASPSLGGFSSAGEGSSSLSVGTQARENDDPYGDAPSIIELLADLPERTEEWTVTMTSFGSAIDKFGQPLVEGNDDLIAANRSSNPFAAKLAVLRRVADSMDGPSRVVEERGAEYMKALLALDPSFKALAAFGHAQTSVSDADRIALGGAQEAVRNMIIAGRGAVEKVSAAIESGRSLARTSRDLRPALRRYEVGAQNILDGQRIMEEWGRLLDSVYWPHSETDSGVEA